MTCVEHLATFVLIAWRHDDHVWNTAHKAQIKGALVSLTDSPVELTTLTGLSDSTDGLLAAAWIVGTFSSRNIYVRVSFDEGQSFGPVVEVTSGIAASIVASPGGRLDLLATRLGPGSVLELVHLSSNDSGASWTGCVCACSNSRRRKTASCATCPTS